ncbi:hypothetical protein GQ55_2G060600 [Panicum hallii var. hallii]|uniref:F-box associated beta-propeller type 3 domain-containing protein n=1 Tax=Panicum hallii var. hallii TaxID=1504633 RepID=A0A2T7ELZ1_9POAL|nr:hypothetical protein GQ55_2G060600 [Panicum hallii var. hallii]
MAPAPRFAAPPAGLMAPTAPRFAPSHATTRRPTGDAVLVAAVHDAADISRVDVKLVDVASGAVVSRLDGQSTGHAIAATGGLICLVPTRGNDRAAPVRVLNPATGAVTDIPVATAADGKTSRSSYVFGQVPVTGEYKVLRIHTSTSRDKPSQSCEILTLGGRGQRWRPAPSPPALVGTEIPRHRAVTPGFAHFFTTSKMADHDGIASFDLAKEQWRPSLLQGPLPSEDLHCCRSSLSLVALNGCLVFVHHDYRSCCIDMWVLAELEKGRWLRVQSLPMGSVLRGWEEETQPAPLIPVQRRREIFAQPLMVLDDGRIAFWVGVPNGVVRVYDPKTRKCKDVVGMGRSCSIVGLCKGSHQLGFA